MLKSLKEYCKNVINYIIGNYRFFIYKIGFTFLIRKHIKEQIEVREALANPACMENKACLKCGCTLPNLLYADKKCGGDCYTALTSKKEWKEQKSKIKRK